MDRVAQLAEEAEIFLRFERFWIKSGKGLAAPARHITRESLAEVARELGFDPLEISAAIDTALAGR